MLRVTAIYPNRAGSRFDSGYYCETHAALARELLGRHGSFDIAVTLGVAALDGAPPPFWAIAEMRFASRADFDVAMARYGEALFADAANYTDVQPILQISRAALPGATEEP